MSIWGEHRGQPTDLRQRENRWEEHRQLATELTGGQDVKGAQGRPRCERSLGEARCSHQCEKGQRGMCREEDTSPLVTEALRYSLIAWGEQEEVGRA